MAAAGAASGIITMPSTRESSTRGVTGSVFSPRMGLELNMAKMRQNGHHSADRRAGSCW